MPSHSLFLSLRGCARFVGGDADLGEWAANLVAGAVVLARAEDSWVGGLEALERVRAAVLVGLTDRRWGAVGPRFDANLRERAAHLRTRARGRVLLAAHARGCQTLLGVGAAVLGGLADRRRRRTRGRQTGHLDES